MAGLDKKAADGLQLRADKLHDHLAHQYRRSCTLSNGCATRCIPYALSGAGAFGCSCTHTHEMSAEEDNERFYLVEDLRGAIATLRVARWHLYLSPLLAATIHLTWCMPRVSGL